MVIAVIRRVLRYLPSLLLAFVLAVVVWISAITAADPVEEQVYPFTIPIQIVGQDPSLVLTSDVPAQINLTLRAPRSILEKINNQQVPIRALMDLSGLGAGEHVVNIQVRIGITPVEIKAFNPATVTLTLEQLISQTLPIRLVQRGQPAVGYQIDSTTLSQATVLVVGPESRVKQVMEVRATVDVANALEDLSRSIALQALDANDVVVQGVSLTPEKVTATVNISQRGGYRNVVVKVQVTGQIASGYRLTNITVSPPVVTVFSADPKLVDNLPGFIETEILDLNGAKDDFDVNLALTLPEGISVFGEQTVLVQVGIAAIEGSITLTNLPVEIIGLAEGLDGVAAPDQVDVIITGPLPLLDILKPENVRVIIELNGEEPGVFQRVPRVEITISGLTAQSVLPGTIEVTVTLAPTPTPGPTPTRTPMPTPTPRP